MVPDLFALFLAEASRQLAFLSARHGFSQSQQRSEWLAETVFARHDCSIRLTYGDRELVANVVISRKSGAGDTSTTYALWEWAEALGVSAQASVIDLCVQTQPQLQRFVDDVARVLDQNLLAILSAGPEVLRSLETARSARVARDQERDTEAALRTASARASEAFWSHRYADVVKQLEPFSARLGAADQQKLEYARRHLVAPSS